MFSIQLFTVSCITLPGVAIHQYYDKRYIHHLFCIHRGDPTGTTLFNGKHHSSRKNNNVHNVRHPQLQKQLSGEIFHTILHYDHLYSQLVQICETNKQGALTNSDDTSYFETQIMLVIYLDIIINISNNVNNNNNILIIFLV